MRVTLGQPSLLVIALVLCANTAAAQLQSAVLDENRTALLRIETAEEQIRGGDLTEGLEFLEQIQTASGDDLVRVAERRYLTVRDECQAVIGRLSPDQMKAFRARIDPQVSQWLARAKRGDRSQLSRIIAEAPHSTAGAEALFELATESWLKGEPGFAYEYWRRLLPAPQVPIEKSERQYNDPLYSPADIAARLVLCRLAMGDLEFARREWAAFARRFPTERGVVFGQTGLLTDLLQKQLRSPAWLPANASSPPSWRTVWSRRLSVQGIPAVATRSEPASFRKQMPLSSAPAFGSGTVFLGDLSTTYGFSSRTGLNPWTSEADAKIHQTEVAPFARATEGITRFDTTIADGRLLARVGSPITSHAPRAIAAAEPNGIVCMDVGRREGKLLWRVLASEVIEGGAFESSPVTHGSRCFVVVRTSPPTSSLHLACLGLEDGELLWERRLCSGLDEPTELMNKATSVRPAVSSTHVIVPTDNGAVCALRHDGRFAWIQTYERSPPIESLMAGTRVLARDAFVYLAPADSDFVMAIREHTGQIMWKRVLPERIQTLIGLANGTLVVSGRGPWGLVGATGEVVWGGPRYSPEHFGYGQGVISGEVLLFPMREQIEVRDVQTGSAVRVPLRISGGNLVADRDQVVLANQDGIMLITRDRTP